MPKSPQVFISYSHETDAQNDRVLTFAARLVTEGIDAMVDQWITDPPGGWPLWTQQKISDADFVLLVCTETFRNNVDHAVEGPAGAGVFWEMSVIRSNIYSSKGTDRRFIPVYFGTTGANFVPIILQGSTYYQIDSSAGYTELYRRLTDQPAAVRPELGTLTVLPRHAAESSGGQAATQLAEHESGLPEASQFKKLKPATSLAEKGLKSEDSGIPTLIRFDNYLREAVNFYWLDYDGLRVYYGSIEAGRSQLQQTYASHPWVITRKDDPSQKCIILFLPAADPCIADIE